MRACVGMPAAAHYARQSPRRSDWTFQSLQFTPVATGAGPLGTEDGSAVDEPPATPEKLRMHCRDAIADAAVARLGRDPATWHASASC